MKPIFNKELEKVVGEVQIILDWYYAKNHEAELNDICKARDKLSVLSAYLSEWCAKLGMDYGLAYISRKYLINARARDYVEMEKITATLANNKAVADSKLELEDEKRKESQSEQIFLLLKAVNNVLSAMQQRISLLSKEKEAHRDTQFVDERIKEMSEGYDNMLQTLQERLDESDTKYKELVERLGEKFKELED